MFSKLSNRSSSPSPKTSQVYNDLRNKVLSLNPRDVGIKPTTDFPNVWGVLMELGYPSAVVTLVTLADGTTSLYFANGGGIIGGGEHAAVVQATKSFLSEVEKYYRQMTPAEKIALPDVGRAKFHVFTYSGNFTMDADEKELESKKHKFSLLYYYGHNVISQLRLIEENRKPRSNVN